jgi:BMFP domain-containing protein YqiC
MAKDNKFLDDFSKLANSTFASMVNMKNEFSKLVRDQVKASLKSMDFVSRNEFNALKHLTSQMRKELDAFNKLGGNEMAATKKTAKRATAKKPAKKAAKRAPAKKAKKK